MSREFLKSSSKRCLHRLLERRSNLFQHHYSTKFPSQPSRRYSPSSPLFNKCREPARSPYAYSSFRHSSNASNSSSSSSSSKNGFIGWYLGMIESHPVLTKSVTSGFIYIIADLSAQTVTLKSSESFDPIRTLRMAGYGMLIMGPALHFWFNFVSKVLPKRDMLATLKKLFMGQAIFGPIMTTTFFSVNAVLQGENRAEVVARLKRDLLPTLRNGLIYWPMCDFVTFKFIPVRLQPLVSNSFAYLWTIYITYMATLDKAGSE